MKKIEFGSIELLNIYLMKNSYELLNSIPKVYGKVKRKNKIESFGNKDTLDRFKIYLIIDSQTPHVYIEDSRNEKTTFFYLKKLK